MRLTVINCILMASAIAVFAEETEEARPRRHLHQIKEMIVNKLFSSSEPNCTQSTEAPPTPPLETKFFRIPGFNNVVIRAVPKGSGEPAQIDEKLQPNSHIGIVGSYLGTSTLNETYNALLGVKNLLTSGILSAKRDMLQELSLAHPHKVQIKPSKPCGVPLPLEPVRILVKPPMVPVVPTQYSYKQVNQDGSITTHASSLELNNGVRVTEDGKTLPFIINRIRKLPVYLPVPVLPEISKIIVSKVTQPASTYAYQQIHQDGRLTSYLGLPSLIGKPGPVVVTETVERIPAPPAFLLNRIEKVAAIASVPRAPFVNIAAKPVVMHTPVDYAIHAPGKLLPAPGPSGYSYSQMSVNGGMTTHSAAGVNGPVLVTENELSAPLTYRSLPAKNPFRHPAGFGAFSHSQIHADGQMRSYNGAQARPVHVLEHRPVLVSPVMPQRPSSFSYTQIGDGRLTTYTGSGILQETFGGNPAVVVHGVNHPVPPPHITDRIEKVAAGAKFNRAPYSTVPFAVPLPDPAKFVLVPPVHTSVPQRPVKMPTTSNTSPFVYKQINNDGSITNYGASGSIVREGKTHSPPPANMEMPFPQGKVRVYDSSIYSGPFPMDPVNPNAIKPSTTVSGSYSYKMVNSSMEENRPIGPIDEPIVDTFAAPPPFLNMPAPIQGCVNPDISISAVGEIGHPMTNVGHSPVLIEKPVPMSYSYKQISHSNSNPFLVVNVEDPTMDVRKVNMNLSLATQAYQPLAPPPLPAVHVVEHKPTVEPALFVPAPIAAMSRPPSPVPQVPIEPLPSSFSYKQVQSQAYPPALPTSQPAVTVTEHRPTAFVELPLPPPQVPVEAAPHSSFSYKQVTSQAYQPLPPAVDVIEHRPIAPAPPPMINMRVPETQKDNSPSSFSYKQVTSQAYPPALPTSQPAVSVTEHRPTAFVELPLPPPQVPVEAAPYSSFSYKQVTSQAYQPLPPAVDVIEHRPIAPAPPPMINMRVPETQKDNSPSSFSYKQVTSQAYPPALPTSQPAVSVTEHRPTAFVELPLPPPQVPVEAAPYSSFSYKQVTSQAYQPLPPAVDVIEHRPIAPAPPPMINMRVPEIQKDNSPSSFSYKQVTSQGLYEYSDEFPTGVKTNQPAHTPQGNPGDDYVQQKPFLSSTMPVPVPVQPMPIPADPMPVLVHPMPVPPSPIPVTIHPTPTPSSPTPIPTFNSRNSLVNNPIVVPEQSSFSFKSSNPDGSTITVKDDGHNSIAVHVEEASKAEESQDAIVSIAPSNNAPTRATSSLALTEKDVTTPAPISGHAKPLRRRVLKRVRPVKHRGDIPEASE